MRSEPWKLIWWGEAPEALYGFNNGAGGTKQEIRLDQYVAEPRFSVSQVESGPSTGVSQNLEAGDRADRGSARRVVPNPAWDFANVSSFVKSLRPCGSLAPPN
jgi:hypothetical protein